MILEVARLVCEALFWRRSLGFRVSPSSGRSYFRSCFARSAIDGSLRRIIETKRLSSSRQRHNPALETAGFCSESTAVMVVVPA